jgi:hypothetical protein
MIFFKHPQKGQILSICVHDVSVSRTPAPQKVGWRRIKVDSTCDNRPTDCGSLVCICHVKAKKKMLNGFRFRSRVKRTQSWCGSWGLEIALSGFRLSAVKWAVNKLEISMVFCGLILKYLVKIFNNLIALKIE